MIDFYSNLWSFTKFNSDKVNVPSGRGLGDNRLIPCFKSVSVNTEIHRNTLETPKYTEIHYSAGMACTYLPKYTHN